MFWMQFLPQSSVFLPALCCYIATFFAALAQSVKDQWIVWYHLQECVLHHHDACVCVDYPNKIRTHFKKSLMFNESISDWWQMATLSHKLVRRMDFKPKILITEIERSRITLDWQDSSTEYVCTIQEKQFDVHHIACRIKYVGSNNSYTVINLNIRSLKCLSFTMQYVLPVPLKVSLKRLIECHGTNFSYMKS